MQTRMLRHWFQVDSWSERELTLRVRAWLAAQGAWLNDSILSNAGSLVGATIVTSGLGFVYWWLAARQFPPQAVGLAAAVISPMMLLGNVGMLGLGTLLMGELPRQRGSAGSLISTALVVTAVMGGLLGFGFALLAPMLSGELQPLGENMTSVTLFALGVSLTAITLVLDQVLIGLVRGGLQLGRNAIFALAKLVGLAVVGLFLASAGGLAIYATWAFGNLVSLVVIARLGWLERPQWGLLRKIGSSALAHHVLNLSLQAPNLILPMIVTLVLSATATAFFYTSWMVVGFAFVPPFALSLALYAVGSGDRAKLARKIRLTLGLALGIALLANVSLVLGADWILRLFGPAYAAQGAASLRILAFGVWPLILTDHYVAIRRIEGRTGQAALLVSLGGALQVVLASAGGIVGGLAGLALGWVVAVCLQALVAAPTVYHAAVPAGNLYVRAADHNARI